jgi:hypothetical protein
MSMIFTIQGAGDDETEAEKHGRCKRVNKKNGCWMLRCKDGLSKHGKPLWRFKAGTTRCPK